MRLLTAGEIRSLEECAVNAGVTMEQLMENAGTTCAEFILEKMDVEGRNVVILCGKGNNGGDGFVVTRELFKDGVKVRACKKCGAAID